MGLRRLDAANRNRSKVGAGDTNFKSQPTRELDRLEAAADRAIAACGGDARQTVTDYRDRISRNGNCGATSRRLEWLRSRKVRTRVARPQVLI